MTQPANSKGESITVIRQKLDICIAILRGERIPSTTLENLNKFRAKMKNNKPEEVLSEFVNIYIKSGHYQDDYMNMYGQKFFEVINLQNNNITQQFIIDNLINIVKFGFKNRILEDSFVILILNLARKQNHGIQPVQEEEQEHQYQYVKKQYEEVQNELQEIRDVLIKEDNVRGFDGFINYIYEAIKSMEAKEIERRKVEEEVLSYAQKAKCEAPKKVSKPKNRQGATATHGNLENSQEETTQASEIICTNNDEIVVAKLRGALLNLILLQFPDEKAKEFEEELKLDIFECESTSQAEGHDQEIVQLYTIIVDFYLLHIQYNIKHYNDRYGRKIEQTKDQFGTKDFDSKINRYITSNLKEIASITQDIYNDLKKVHSFLNKITPLVYRDCHSQLQGNSNEKWLEMSGCDNLELLSKFLDHLHILGEWRNSKLGAVRELGIQNKKKTKSDKQMERQAFKNIKLCVDSLSEFMNTNNRCQLPSEKNSNFDKNSPSAECYGPHQQWCYLSHIKVEMVTIPVDGRHCSC